MPDKYALISFLILTSVSAATIAECISGDCKNGHGTAEDENGLYQGNFKDGKRHGWGSIYNAEGDGYVGQFSKGNFHGTARLIKANGNKYEGQWLNGKMTGYATGTYQDNGGRQYTGEFINGSREGSGTYFYADGDSASGNWKESKLDGLAIYIYGPKKKKPSKYIGLYKNGKRHGPGVYYPGKEKAIAKLYENGKQIKPLKPDQQNQILNEIESYKDSLKEQYPVAREQKQLLREFGKPSRFNLLFTDPDNKKGNVRAETWYYDSLRTWFQFIESDFYASGPIEDSDTGIINKLWSPTDFHSDLTPESGVLLLSDYPFSRIDIPADHVPHGNQETITTLYSQDLIISFANGKLVSVIASHSDSSSKDK